MGRCVVLSLAVGFLPLLLPSAIADSSEVASCPATGIQDWLVSTNVTLRGADVRVGKAGHLEVVATERIVPGNAVLTVPFALRFCSRLLSEADRTVVETVPEHRRALFATAAALLRADPLWHGWRSALYSRVGSGTGFTPAERECLYRDVEFKIQDLEEATRDFRELAARLGDGVDADLALLAVVRHGRGMAGSEGLVLLPGVDLFAPMSSKGKVVPGRIVLDEKGDFTSVTFTVWSEVQAGEVLRLAPIGESSIFATAAYFGVVEEDFATLPIDLTWRRLSPKAMQVLKEHGCGETATTLVYVNGTYDATVLKCLEIVAAFQTMEEKEAAGIDFTSDNVPLDVQLAKFDLLSSVLDEARKKVPDGCEGEGTIASMNKRILHTLENADLRIEAEADPLVDRANTRYQ